MPKLNWWAGVCLCRAGASRGKPNAFIARGQLCEMLTRALEFAPGERATLFISYEVGNRRLAWARMQELIGRPDFPIFI